jgi:hypothetical protein
VRHLSLLRSKRSIAVSVSLTAVATWLMVPTPAVAQAPISVAAAIRAYAPFVLLHPDDRYRPMSAGRFVRDSELRWSHRRCNDSSIAARGSITTGRLGQLGPGGYSHRQINRCLFPFGHTHRGRSYFSGELTRPWDGGNPWPILQEPEGFFMELSDSSRPGLGTNAGIYYEYRNVIGGEKSIVYWLFYGFNRSPGPRPVARAFDHEGDWERIAVLLGDDNRARTVAYYGHEGSCTLPWSATPKHRGHPVVFSAIGSHASYPYAGSFPTEVPRVRDHTARGGPQWRTWRRMFDAFEQGWWGYGGAWGHVGRNPTGNSTGPLGPSPHKGRPSFSGARCQRPGSSSSATLVGDQLDVGAFPEAQGPVTDEAVAVAALNAEADALAGYLSLRRIPYTIASASSFDTAESAQVRTVVWDQSSATAVAAVESFYQNVPLDPVTLADRNADADALAAYLAARGIAHTVTTDPSGLRTVAWDQSNLSINYTVQTFYATRVPMDPTDVTARNAESDARASYLASRGIAHSVTSDPWGVRTVRWDTANAAATGAVDAHEASRNPVGSSTVAALNAEADALAQTLRAQGIPHTVSTDAWGVRKLTWDETNEAAANAVAVFDAAHHPLPPTEIAELNAEADALALRLQQQAIPYGVYTDPWGVRNVTWDETNPAAVAAVDTFYNERRGPE